MPYLLKIWTSNINTLIIPYFDENNLNPGKINDTGSAAGVCNRTPPRCSYVPQVRKNMDSGRILRFEDVAPPKDDASVMLPSKAQASLTVCKPRPFRVNQKAGQCLKLTVASRLELIKLAPFKKH